MRIYEQKFGSDHLILSSMIPGLNPLSKIIDVIFVEFQCLAWFLHSIDDRYGEIGQVIIVRDI